MYLKSIEIHGFKSFANKIVFEFPEGITGIVGPNGSGKSNVADAVRWVLGEQKIKQLRGSKMEDVIFAGTSNRKPQSYAYVAITLDNSDHKLKLDYDTVTISRRVYRSGESEYMMNGSVCRLKDVQELFYDTGIGKEGYSIIGQGQIDKILQGKPEERREIFDEAVGIVKFKKRKNLALKKLENERLNLSRVNDILTELKRQVGPLKRQSEAAEQFVVYKNDLKKYDINLFLFENGDIKSKIREYQDKEELARHNLEQARIDYENTKAEYETISISLSEIEDKINNIKSLLSRANIIKENLNGQINVLSEQIKSIKASQSSYEERMTALNQQLSEEKEELEHFKSEKEKNQTELTAAISTAAIKDSTVLDIQSKNDELRKTIEDSKERIIALVNDRARISGRMERLDATLEQIKKRREELQSNLERYTSAKADREKEINDLLAELDTAKADLTESEEKLNSKTQALKQAENEIRLNEAELSQTKEKIVKDRASLESLRNITERYEGYGNSVREIMKLKEKNPGIHGVVADIIRTEKKYETAIETALGGNIQNVVTDNEATAKKVIEYLKQNKLGRATFLPLKAITGRGEFKNTDVLNENGVIGLACELVNVDDKYKGVASYLLGKIVVVDTIDHALVIARKYNYSNIMVTLEGELLNKGGSLTGGAFRNKSNLLGRRREMDELEASIQALKAKQKELDEKTDKAREDKNKLSEEIDAIQKELQEHRLYLNTIAVNLKAAQVRNEEIEDQFRGVNKENESILEQTDSINTENVTLEQQLKSNDEENVKVKEIIEKAEAELEEGKKAEAEELLLAQTMKVQLSKLTEQNSHLTESIQRVENSINKTANEIKTLEENNTDSTGDVANKENEIEEIRKSMAQADEEAKLQNSELSELEQQKDEMSAAHKDFIKKREEYSEMTANLDKELYRLSAMREKLEERFENKSNYIWEEYQLTYNNALSLRDEELSDSKQMREKIAELKTNIRGLGNINVGAIEEYKEVSERYEFLSKQYEDLQKAEADLTKIIRDLDKEMRNQFNVEFKKIKTEFAKVFKEMFGGGQGTIELEEDMDVLEAGITVIAQPPGKKLQNMMQLSGGEKALTAIALLFAIQNLKPSPFCILDEIEAALDDSNIERYAGYLHKLTKDTQFIVITHRKGTMEAADRLYGITMQERGVSSLISVNLADVEDEQVG